jgi:hypothetical protein
MPEHLDQQHPLATKDRAVVDRLLREGQSDKNLAELARLRIRYQNFPGARIIQKDLDLLLTQWNLTEAELFEQTRAIHAAKLVYKPRNQQGEDDWS